MNLTLKESLVTRSRVFITWTAFYFLQSLLINLGLGYPFSLLYTAAFTAILLFAMANIASRTKSSGRCQFAGGGLLFPFAQAYGAPNFNTLLALHSTNMEESTEILTIFPLVQLPGRLIYFCARRNSNQAKKRMKKRAGIPSTACVWYSVWRHFLLLPCKTWPGVAYLN